MTIQEVQDRLDEISRQSDLSSEGHILEDQLHQDVLRAIAKNKVDSPQEIAELALSSSKIEIPRWYE